LSIRRPTMTSTARASMLLLVLVVVAVGAIAWFLRDDHAPAQQTADRAASTKAASKQEQARAAEPPTGTETLSAARSEVAPAANTASHETPAKTTSAATDSAAVASMSGRVVDESGAPIEGAEVTLMNPFGDGPRSNEASNSKVITGADGRFVFTELSTEQE